MRITKLELTAMLKRQFYLLWHESKFVGRPMDSYLIEGLLARLPQDHIFTRRDILQFYQNTTMNARNFQKDTSGYGYCICGDREQAAGWLYLSLAIMFIGSYYTIQVQYLQRKDLPVPQEARIGERAANTLIAGVARQGERKPYISFTEEDKANLTHNLIHHHKFVILLLTVIDHF